ncbi:disulfide bond formation protein B [Sandaracinobacteroides saxicola]|uniref:Disulfide bond formation protein B n=1 Tax=Sandaracinobacteroides saxicola TaxID=2759707 RepID=A0A7G5IHV3_9SPHN|nr:disulfide bond formation protein B [Sandaracinobacteroides saxicola]QMW22945.1 disulfide bond formation protein B [Sandaracinobacteroides saxicola]
MPRERQALALLLLTSAALLGGALAFQFIGRLAPCEMCYWQRYAHLAVLALGLLAWVAGSRALILLAALAMLVAAGLGGFHAGVEQHWWQGPTACSSGIDFTQSSGALIGSMIATPVVRCDAIPWSLLGLSMAAWNAVISGTVALAALWLWRRA